MSNQETTEKLSSAVANIESAIADLVSLRAIDETITISLTHMTEVQEQLLDLRNYCIDNECSL
jgi:hypothetical protein